MWPENSSATLEIITSRFKYNSVPRPGSHLKNTPLHKITHKCINISRADSTGHVKVMTGQKAAGSTLKQFWNLKTSNLPHTDFEIWVSTFKKSFSNTGKTLAFNYIYSDNHIKVINVLFGEKSDFFTFNSLNPELNLICYLLALLGAHHFLRVSRIRVKSLTLRLLMSYIYGAHILDVSKSHTTTQHSR